METPQYIEVCPGVFITEEEHEANMQFDEWRDNLSADESNVY